MCTVLQSLYEVWGCCCAASVYWIDWIMCLGSWGLWPSEDEATHISAVMLWWAEAEPEEVACRQSLICSSSCSLSMPSHVRCDVIQSSYRLPLLNHSNNGTVSIACSEDCGTADRVVVMLLFQFRSLWGPLLPYGYSYKHPVLDRVKPSFVIFDIRALWRLVLSARVPGCQKLQMTA